MKITYPKTDGIAELSIDETPVKYSIPPAIGTHQEVFQRLSANKRLRIAEGREIVAYANGCLVYKQNDWADPNRLKFPMDYYLRFPAVLTFIPIRKRFGDLQGAVLVDSDLNGGGIKMRTSIPKDLSGWTISKGGIYTQGTRKLVPYKRWYSDPESDLDNSRTEGSRNGLLIALCGGVDGAKALEKTAEDSNKNLQLLVQTNVSEDSTPEKLVPVLIGSRDMVLELHCVVDSIPCYGIGCGVGILKEKN